MVRPLGAGELGLWVSIFIWHHSVSSISIPLLSYLYAWPILIQIICKCVIYTGEKNETKTLKKYEGKNCCWFHEWLNWIPNTKRSHKNGLSPHKHWLLIVSCFGLWIFGLSVKRSNHAVLLFFWGILLFIWLKNTFEFSNKLKTLKPQGLI